jgi:hypothetical protein
MNNPIAVLDAPYRFGPPTLVDVTTSVPTDADTAPTWQVYEDGSAMSGQSGTLTKLASLTGVYEATFTPTTANGFEVGKDYTLVVAAQVDGVAGVYKIGFVVDVRSSTLSSAIIGVSALANAANENAQLAATHGNTLTSRLSSLRAGYLDKLNVAGTLAHTSNADTFKADVSGLASQASVTDIQTKIGNPASPSGNTLAKMIDDVEGGGGGGYTPPISQIAVPREQTFDLVRGASGWAADRKHVTVDDEDIYAVDFHRALATNGRLGDLVAAEVISGDAEGLVVDSDSFGVDKSLAKFKANAVTAGTYEIRVTVEKSPESGGGEISADIVFVVRP